VEHESDHALLDDLTGAWNRRALRELFEREWQELVAARGPVALLLLDLDLFKEVNDRHGHLVGDDVLRRTVARLRDGFRAGDRIFRYGGDEFVVVLPGTGAEEASELAARVRKALDGARAVDSSGTRRGAPEVSFSVGVAVAPDDGATGDEVLAAADARLYVEKRDRKEEHDAARRRRRFVAAVVVAAVVAAAAGYLSRLASPPPPPAVGRAPVEAIAEPGDSPEIEALRAEVERLTQALDEARSEDTRHEYEGRIRDLESKLDEARERAAMERTAAAARVAPPAPVTPPVAVPQPAGDETPRLEAGSRKVRVETVPEVPRPQATAAGVSHTSVAIAAPQLLRHEPPRYPILARRRRVQGTVELRLTIGADGSVTGAQQVSPRLGYGLDEAALRSALTAVYRPATRDGRPIASEAKLQVRFVLEDSGGGV